MTVAAGDIGAQRDAHRDSAGYADLRSYAAIGDGRTVALVSSDGRIDWLSLPELTSVTPFAALLDADHGGAVTLAPVEPYTARRHYVPGTLVLVTEFRTASGSVRVTDSMNTGVGGRLPWSELARRIEGVDGEVELRAEVRPGTCFNRYAPWIEETTHGVVLRLDSLTMAVRAHGDDDVEWDDRSIRLRFTTSPGSRSILGVVATEAEPLFLPDPDVVDAGVDRTIANWQRWSEEFAWDGAYAEQVQRSALTLKLLLNSPNGSIAAAATTSLPESKDGGKNWDYRFAWVRDMAFSLTAMFRFGMREETHAAMSWLLRIIRASGERPHVLYTLDGAPVDDSVEHHDVPGWRGIGPVVTGNQASGQLQLGVYGDLFSIVRLYVDGGNVLDAHTGRALARIADVACDQWRRKDSGMWELPDQRHYVSSKMGCWQALQHAVHLAEVGQIPGDPSRWRSEGERIRAWVDEHGWSQDKQSYVWYAGSDELDASVLLHAISGYDRGPRMSSTLDALDRELGAGPHLYRYSGAADEEATFVACSYWMVSALALVGRADEARERMDRLLAAPNDVGLLAEMIDVTHDDAFLGNIPQALSHLALMNAAITLDENGSGASGDPAVSSDA